MPLPNNHTCHIHDSDDFQEGSIRTIKRGDLTIRIGRLKGKTTTTSQSYLYPKPKWAEAAARQHCKKAGGTFEPATKGGKSMDMTGDYSRDTVILFDDGAQFTGVEMDGETVPVDDLIVAYKAQSEREKKRAARETRAKRYGIGAKEGGNLTPPKGYPTSDADYGDPVNYRYPADAAHARPALAYFNHEGQREAGGYTSAEWAVIGKRLAKLISKHLEASYEHRAGKVQKKGEGKSYSLDERRRQVRDAWKAQFMKPTLPGQPISDDYWVKEVFDDQVIVETPQGLAGYPYTINDEGEVEFGEPTKVKIVYQPVSSKALAVKALREENGGVVVGGYLLLWGTPEKKDLGGDYFTPKTELWLDAYRSVPALFHHGLDQDVGLAVMGKRVAHKTDDTGVWVEDWLDKSNKFWTMVKPLLDAEALYYSPGSAPHLVKREKDGKLKSFPVVEDTLTPIPMQHRLLPVEQIHKAYKAIGLDLPQLGGDESGDSCLEVDKAKAEVDILLSEIEMEV